MPDFVGKQLLQLVLLLSEFDARHLVSHLLTTVAFPAQSVSPVVTTFVDCWASISSDKDWLIGLMQEFVLRCFGAGNVDATQTECVVDSVVSAVSIKLKR